MALEGDGELTGREDTMRSCFDDCIDPAKASFIAEFATVLCVCGC